jgi:hypothetical protein
MFILVSFDVGSIRGGKSPAALKNVIQIKERSM